MTCLALTWAAPVSTTDRQPRPRRGWYLEEYLVASRADRFNDVNGNKLQLPKQDVDVLAMTTQIIYVGQPLANGAMPGITAINTSLAHVDVDDGLDNTVLSSRAGFGDVVIGPFLQLPTLARRRQPLVGPADRGGYCGAGGCL